MHFSFLVVAALSVGIPHVFSKSVYVEPCNGTEKRIDLEYLGGEKITRRAVKIMVESGNNHQYCEWVLEGSTSYEYTKISDCASCKASKDGIYCLGSALSMKRGCSAELGIDCSYHFTDELDKTKPCVVQCEGSKTETEVLGGKTITRTAVKMMVGSECVWVLEGSTQTQFTKASDCSRCEMSKDKILCVGSPLVFPLPGCSAELGIDCQHYSTDELDKTKPCDQCKGSKTETEVLGGKTITRTAVKMMIGSECVWVLEGSTKTRFTKVSDCSRCTVFERGTGCTLPPRFVVPKGCAAHLGIDCKQHKTHVDDKTKLCNTCDENMMVSERIGNKQITQSLVTMLLPSANGSKTCHWVLENSIHVTDQGTKFTFAKSESASCSTCTKTVDGHLACVSSGLVVPPLGCRVVTGIDCRHYFIDNNDDTKICRE